jgi:tetratricopeptide (TPR) repeat protein
VDIPFFRFALPVVILYFYWNMFVVNPWVEEASDSTPNSLSVTKSQELLVQSRKLVLGGQYAQALDPSMRLYKAFPENYLYSQQLAQIYGALEQWPESAQMWEHYVQYAPTPTDGCPMLGFAYENMGQTEQAFKAHERCWQFDRSNSDMIFFYAQALEHQGQYARAAKLYEQGLKRSPTYPDLLVGLARAQMQLGQFAAARHNLQEVLEKRPDNTDALFAEGLLHARLGEVRAAIQDLEHAHRMAPGYREAEILLAQLRGMPFRHVQ